MLVDTVLADTVLADTVLLATGRTSSAAVSTDTGGWDAGDGGPDTPDLPASQPRCRAAIVALAASAASCGLPAPLAVMPVAGAVLPVPAVAGAVLPVSAAIPEPGRARPAVFVLAALGSAAGELAAAGLSGSSPTVDQDIRGGTESRSCGARLAWRTRTGSPFSSPAREAGA